MASQTCSGRRAADNESLSSNNNDISQRVNQRDNNKMADRNSNEMTVSSDNHLLYGNTSENQSYASDNIANFGFGPRRYSSQYPSGTSGGVAGMGEMASMPDLGGVPLTASMDNFHGSREYGLVRTSDGYGNDYGRGGYGGQVRDSVSGPTMGPLNGSMGNLFVPSYMSPQVGYGDPRLSTSPSRFIYDMRPRANFNHDMESPNLDFARRLSLNHNNQPGYNIQSNVMDYRPQQFEAHEQNNRSTLYGHNIYENYHDNYDVQSDFQSDALGRNSTDGVEDNCEISDKFQNTSDGGSDSDGGIRSSRPRKAGRPRKVGRPRKTTKPRKAKVDKSVGFSMADNKLPSRFSGHIPKPPGVNKVPFKLPDEVSDASLLKRDLTREGEEKAGRRAAGANDPENILIVNMFENQGMKWAEIAHVLNKMRVQTGREPTFTPNAIHNRYNRNAPLLFAAEGKAWVPINERGEVGETVEASTGTMWNDELDTLLIKIVKDVEWSKWTRVADTFNEQTGLDITPLAAAHRHKLI